MKKKLMLLLAAAVGFAGSVSAQIKCSSDEVLRNEKALHPEVEAREKQFNNWVRQQLVHLDPSQIHNKIASDSVDYFDIPVVVHVIHSYQSVVDNVSGDYLTDDAIVNLIARMNRTYSLQNDTSAIIQPFKKYVGKANIRFHLAIKDPSGNPTIGITRRYSYLTYGGGEQAKVDQWDPTSYYNIWFENVIGMGVAGGTVLAYAHFPYSAESDPYHDGVICAAPFLNDGSTIEHETGHYLSLYHTWNSSGAPCGTIGACGDDEVDDTPPTIGHPDPSQCGTSDLYDTSCANNYYKIYDSTGSVILVNYPDTTNVQNIMDYACELMFTQGQVDRMRISLASNIGHRDSLVTNRNLFYTGITDDISNPSMFMKRPDLKPIPDFFCAYSTSKNPQYFTCPGTPLKFSNRSWGDTISSIVLNFGSDAGPSAATTTWSNNSYSNSVSCSFSNPGWVPITMTATGNHTGDSIRTINNMVFVADATGVDPNGYSEEFDPAADAGKWPTFNYFNNEFKWEASNAGYLDGHSMKYNGYDARIIPMSGTYPQTGYPKGDYDDMFSRPVDLSGFSATDNCNLNFFYSGASRSSNTNDINDSMVISVSTDGAKTWSNIATMKKGSLLNKGAISVPYAPLYSGDWAAKTINIPTGKRTNYAVFRFRYFPNTGADGVYSSGNNFYIDNITFSKYAAEVSSVKTAENQVVVAPNPTSNNAYVIINDSKNTTANIVVTDIAGRVTYTSAQALNGGETRIEIPQSAITAKGVYMVQTITGGQSNTQKLVVY